jgi:hypothetical protein
MKNAIKADIEKVENIVILGGGTDIVHSVLVDVVGVVSVQKILSGMMRSSRLEFLMRWLQRTLLMLES